MHCRCQGRISRVQTLSGQDDKEVFLSRHIDEIDDKGNGVIIHPAPDCSFAKFDPGKILMTQEPLSSLEKTAIAEFVVAGTVHKVRGAKDVNAAYRLKGHNIVFPINMLGSVATRNATLPRSDVADLHRIMWNGDQNSYAANYASLLNLRRLKMKYSKVVQALKVLKVTHPRYRDIDIKEDTVCSLLVVLLYASLNLVLSFAVVNRFNGKSK